MISMGKSALVVVDMQNYFINKTTKDLPVRIQKFIVKNREMFDHIIFTKFVNSSRSNFVRLLGWKKCFKSPETDIHEALIEFTRKSNVFTKTAFSAFKSRNFAEFLKENKITDLYVCGTDTEACVFATAIDAFDSGYRIKVLKDLCGSQHGKKFHKIGCLAIEKNIEKHK